MKGVWVQIVDPGPLGPQPYRMEAHHWTPFRRLPWAFCRKCGLIGLRTPITEWCTKKGCNYRDHPGWLEAVGRLIPRRVT